MTSELLQQYSIEQIDLLGTAIFLGLFIILWLRSQTKISKLKKQQLADQIDLEESGKKEKWFQVFSETIPQAYWIQNKEQVIFASSYFENLTGLTETTIVKRFETLFERCHDEDKECVIQAHKYYIKNYDAPLELDFRYRKGNKTIWLKERIFPYQHANGELFHVGILEDQTQKQDHLKSIKDSSILLDNILTSTDEGILGLDLDLKPIYWNREMELISGKSKESLMDGQNLFSHFPHLVNTEVDEIIRKTLKGVITPPQTFPFHISGSRKGHTMSKYLPLLNSTESIIGVIGFIQDQSEEMARETILEKTQERYSLTLQAIQDGIWDWDLQNKSIIFSDQWFAMLGYAPTELSSSFETMKTLLTSSEEFEKIQVMENDLLAGRAIDQEVLMKHADGSTRCMLIRGKSIETDVEGQQKRAIGISSDISDRKAYELELLAAKEKAEESVKLKAALMANMSHEIRTPLNGIVGFTDLLMDDDLSLEERKKFQQEIHKNTVRLTLLFNDIILLSNIQAGQLKLNTQSFNLVELMKETATEVYKEFGQEKASKVKMKLAVPFGQSSIDLHSDQSLVRRILSHLIKNACTYTKEGMVTLGLQLPDLKTLKIFIQDTGIGIKPEDQQKIFEQFVQLDGGLNRSQEGTGLGLALTQSIVSILGGSIALESEIGQGSRFEITLPYQIPSDKL